MPKGYGDEEIKALLSYIEKMRRRYPSLSERQMALQAGLPNNAIYKIKDGVRPRPATLKALAMQWGRSDEERVEDYRQLMTIARYTVIEERAVTEEEWKWVQRFRELSDEQKAQAELFFRAYGAGETLEVLSRGVIAPMPQAGDAFHDFLQILQAVSAMGEEERIALIGEALRRFREERTPGDNH